MKRLLVYTAMLAGLSAAGCRSAGNQELLERDLRLQEDRINHLQGHVADYRQQIECLQAENDALRAQVGALQGGALPPVRPAIPYRTPQILPPGSQTPEGQAPGGRAPGGGPAELPLGPPKIELPPNSSSDARGPQNGPLISSEVAQLSFNPQLTGGYDNDQQPGDDGVVVCIEPRSASGEIIQWQGPLSIVLMDPALAGEAARLARWDLAEGEVAAHFRRSARGAGIQFELPWPTGVPPHRQLKLFARYTAADGRKLDASQDIEIVRPGEVSRRWTRSAHQSRFQTVPILDPARSERDLREPIAGPDHSDDSDDSDDPPDTATARRPQWSPYR